MSHSVSWFSSVHRCYSLAQSILGFCTTTNRYLWCVVADLLLQIPFVDAVHSVMEFSMG